MPEKIYATKAEKQKAYRERKKAAHLRETIEGLGLQKTKEAPVKPEPSIEELVAQYEKSIMPIVVDSIKNKVQVLPTAKQSKKGLPDTWTMVEQVVKYIQEHNIKSFNVHDKKFRTTQIEKICAIIKDLYG